MSDDPRGLERLRFEYLIPEFARPDFKLPSEWDIIGTIFQGYKLIDPEKVKAHMKGNKPMDEEVFPRVEFDYHFPRLRDAECKPMPKVSEEGDLVDWVKLNTETVSSYDDVNAVYRADTHITLVADKITEAQEKLFRDWLISRGWTPPKEDREDV